MTTIFEREIREQPDCLARLLEVGRGRAAEIADAIATFSPAFVVTAARGSSDNAARYAKYVLGAQNGLVVSLGAPSLVTIYGAAPRLDRALVIGISQSGESPDIVALLREGRRQGALTVAITNKPGSPLAQAAVHSFDLGVGVEQAVVASKSYTSQLMALAMLSASIADARQRDSAGDRWGELERLPDAARETLSLHPDDQWVPGGLAAADRMVVVGRGFNFATAFEIALKLKETAYVMADPYATPDLFHGPMALVEAGIPALVIAASGATLSSTTSALEALEERGAETTVISDDPAVLARPGTGARLPFAPVAEWLSPIVAVIPGQLCALRLARHRRLDPDQPRGLTKVTRTR